MTARAAFDTVGDFDDELTDEQLERLMAQLAVNVLEHGDDPGYEGILDGQPVRERTLDEDSLLERLGISGDAGDDELAFEARWGDEL